MAEKFDIKLRVMVVGDHAVGKTSLIRRYAENTFTDNYIATVGVDFSAKSMKIPVHTKKDKKEFLSMRFMLYDIGGQAQYQNRIEAWAPQTMMYVICYDITQPSTLQNVHMWHKIITETVTNLSQPLGYTMPYTFVLVGTKADISPKAENRENLKHVSKDQLKNICNQLKINYSLETSAKTGEKVKILFDALGNLAFNNLIRLNQLELKKQGISDAQMSEKYFQEHEYFPIFQTIKLQ